MEDVHVSRILVRHHTVLLYRLKKPCKKIHSLDLGATCLNGTQTLLRISHNLVPLRR